MSNEKCPKCYQEITKNTAGIEGLTVGSARSLERQEILEMVESHKNQPFVGFEDAYIRGYEAALRIIELNIKKIRARGEKGGRDDK